MPFSGRPGGARRVAGEAVWLPQARPGLGTAAWHLDLGVCSGRGKLGVIGVGEFVTPLPWVLIKDTDTART